MYGDEWEKHSHHSSFNQADVPDRATLIQLLCPEHPQAYQSGKISAPNF